MKKIFYSTVVLLTAVSCNNQDGTIEQKQTVEKIVETFSNLLTTSQGVFSVLPTKSEFAENVMTQEKIDRVTPLNRKT